MTQFLLIHVGDEQLKLNEADAAEVDATLDSWFDEVTRLRVNLQGSRLRPTGDATTVRVRNGELIVTDGPFAETKEQVGGYDLLECADADEALAWAAKHPTTTMGAIEIRALVPDAPQTVLPIQRPGTLRYVLLICVGQGPSPEEAADVPAQTDAWVAETGGQGVRLCGNELAPIATARTVRVRDGQTLITDGPFAETKEQIAGFDILECADLDQALDAAAKHPVARFGALEIRPFWPFED